MGGGGKGGTTNTSGWGLSRRGAVLPGVSLQELFSVEWRVEQRLTVGRVQAAVQRGCIMGDVEALNLDNLDATALTALQQELLSAERVLSGAPVETNHYSGFGSVDGAGAGGEGAGAMLGDDIPIPGEDALYESNREAQAELQGVCEGAQSMLELRQAVHVGSWTSVREAVAVLHEHLADMYAGKILRRLGNCVNEEVQLLGYVVDNMAAEETLQRVLFIDPLGPLGPQCVGEKDGDAHKRGGGGSSSLNGRGVGSVGTHGDDFDVDIADIEHLGSGLEGIDIDMIEVSVSSASLIPLRHRTRRVRQLLTSAVAVADVTRAFRREQWTQAEAIFQRLNEPVTSISSDDDGSNDDDDDDDGDDGGDVGGTQGTRGVGGMIAAAVTTMDELVPSARRRLQLAEHRITSTRIAR